MEQKEAKSQTQEGGLYFLIESIITILLFSTVCMNNKMSSKWKVTESNTVEAKKDISTT